MQMTTENIYIVRANLKMAQDRQRSYTNFKWANIKYDIGKKVFLKISPWKGMLRFDKSGKLSPRFIGPYEIIKCIGLVAYRLALPPTLFEIHDVFHVLMLRRYRSDTSHILHE